MVVIKQHHIQSIKCEDDVEKNINETKL